MLVLGLVVLYTIIHFIVISFNKTYKDRNVYEKIVTITGIIFIALIIISLTE